MEPQIEAEAPVEGSVFRYKARIEVKPAIELPDLDAISGKRPAVQVGEEEVLTELETLRERQADWVEEAEDVAAAEGHQLTIDFVGTIDGVAFEGGSAEGVELELGSGRMIPGFEEQLVGARSGEKRNLEVGFPADYGNAELAGKPAVFATTVTAIKRKELPELDDDFAKDLGEEFERLDDVREKIREVLRSQRQHASDHALHRSLLDDLIARQIEGRLSEAERDELRQLMASKPAHRRKQ